MVVSFVWLPLADALALEQFSFTPPTKQARSLKLHSAPLVDFTNSHHSYLTGHLQRSRSSNLVRHFACYSNYRLLDMAM